MNYDSFENGTKKKMWLTGGDGRFKTVTFVIPDEEMCTKREISTRKNSIFYLFVILTIFLYTLCAFFRVFIEKRALSDKACLEKIHLFSKIFQKRYIKLPILEVVLIRPPVVMKLPLMMFPSIFFSVSWEVYF